MTSSEQDILNEIEASEGLIEKMNISLKDLKHKLLLCRRDKQLFYYKVICIDQNSFDHYFIKLFSSPDLAQSYINEDLEKKVNCKYFVCALQSINIQLNEFENLDQNL